MTVSKIKKAIKQTQQSCKVIYVDAEGALVSVSAAPLVWEVQLLKREMRRFVELADLNPDYMSVIYVAFILNIKNI